MGGESVQTIAKGGPKLEPTKAVPLKFGLQHFTVAEIGSFWKLSEDTVRRLFEKEPDVLVIGNQKPRFGRRQRMKLRIPEFVVERVHRRLSRP